MATPTSLEAPLDVAPTREDLIRAYRAMYMSRRIDDREILLKRQNRIFFQISGAGHEAVQAAAGLVLRPAHDWFYLYYRDRALAWRWASRPRRCCWEPWARPPIPRRADGRCPRTGARRSCTSSVGSSPTGTQFLQAVGCAHANRYLDPTSDAVTLVCTGEGATSEGEFWESLNVACLESAADHLSGRRQRLRHLRTGGETNRRRRYFADWCPGFPNLKRS